MSTQRVGGRRRRKTLGRRKMKKSLSFRQFRRRSQKRYGGVRQIQYNIQDLNDNNLNYSDKKVLYDGKFLQYTNSVVLNKDRSRLDKITNISNNDDGSYTVSYYKPGLPKNNIILQSSDIIEFTLT